jgi:hypothetical protein
MELFFHKQNHLTVFGFKGFLFGCFFWFGFGGSEV